MSSYRILAQNISEQEISFLKDFVAKSTFMAPHIETENDWVAIDAFFEGDFDLKKNFAVLLCKFIDEQDNLQMKRLLSKCQVLDTSDWSRTRPWPSIQVQAEIARLG